MDSTYSPFIYFNYGGLLLNSGGGKGLAISDDVTQPQKAPPHISRG